MISAGLISVFSSSDPAGMMTTEPLRDRRGRGDPQVRQKAVEKLFASGRSYLTTLSSPLFHVNLSGGTKILATCPVPVAFRHRGQKQYLNFSIFGSHSYSTSPHKQLPFRDSIFSSLLVSTSGPVRGRAELSRRSGDARKSYSNTDSYFFGSHDHRGNRSWWSGESGCTAAHREIHCLVFLVRIRKHTDHRAVGVAKGQ